MKKYILSLDQGTTSSRAILYNEQFEVLAVGQKEFPQHYPQPDWVEHNLDEIWTSVQYSIQKALENVKDADFKKENIVAIGITNQRETFGVWDRNSLEPLHNAIVWQCRRSADICKKLAKTPAGKKLKSITGLVIDPYFSGTKLKWLLDKNKNLNAQAKKSELCFGTIDTFLVAKLSAGESFVTDTSNASRTLMMDLKNCQWSEAALKILGIPRGILPEIRSSDARFGATKGLSLLPDGIPIHGILGDQQAALFGQACQKEGEAKATYGTGAFLLLNTGSKIKRSKHALSTVAWSLSGKTTYAMEGSVFIAGAAVQWLRDNLGIFVKSSDSEGLAASVKDTDGVYFIPALSGLGSPYWAPEAKGIIGGLTRRSSKAHVARACLEAIAHSVADQFESIVKDAGTKLKALKVDGGASKNALLLQMQADYLQAKVLRPQDVESTARGAAYMAALGCGLFKKPSELVGKNPVDIEIAPKLSKKEALRQRKLWSERVWALVKATPKL